MIIRETEHSFVMTEQHEHARFAGAMAAHLQQRLFQDPAYMEDVLLAVGEHDRGWIRLDDTPIWNDAARAPFSFSDYPLLPKLVLYKTGIDEVEAMNPYAALLCSLHYASFSHLQSSPLEDCAAFLAKEKERRQRLAERLKQPDCALIERHVRLLQWCDQLSLYVCMNEPGAAKDQEHPWYRNGFDTRIEDRDIHARWLGVQEIQVEPFYFEQAFTASLRSKHVNKTELRRAGIAEAYRKTDWTVQEVRFCTPRSGTGEAAP